MLFLKRNKTFYYLHHYTNYYFFNKFRQGSFEKKLIELSKYFVDDYDNIDERVNYYNKINKSFIKNDTAVQFKKLYKNHKKNPYFFDLTSVLRNFNWDNWFSIVFGDVTHIPDQPSFVKSRPISVDNTNSILLKLNKVRHYFFVNDKKEYKNKKNMLVWRGDTRSKPHRINFIKKLWNHPMCDVGQTLGFKENSQWSKEKMSINEQLDYKFIFCIEGNDVATNLKWAMSSNSLVFSYRLKYETWFMEGKLKENHHFVLIKDDLSDLDEKMNYYNIHIEEALDIIKNANDYVKKFKDEKREEYIELLVTKKYFEYQE